MTEWEPATDAEIAMRNALRTDDQESYFRILAGVDLLLPVSADALAGLAPLGWGTWSTGGRTHVLAFTSPSALQACLADYTGSARRVAYAELADTWPNLEWWLAVNPGLPIEGYLPAWFVAQLSRGDLRLPTRGPGREGSNAPNRIQDLHAAATLAATAAAQGYNAAAQTYAGPGSGGPIPGSPAPAGSGSGAAQRGSDPGTSSGAPAYGGPGSGGPGTGGPGIGGPGTGGPGTGGPGGPAYSGPGSGGRPDGDSSAGAPSSGGPAYGGAVPSGLAGPGSGGSGAAVPAGLASAPGSTSSGGPAPLAGSAASASSGYGGSPSDVRPSGDSATGRPAAGPGGRLSDSSASPAAADAGSGAPVGPGGLPLRTPGGVLPSGLPARVPGTPAGQDGGIPGGQFNGFGTSSGSRPAQPADQPSGRPGDRGRPGGAAPEPTGRTGNDVPAAYQPPTLPPGGPAGSGAPARPASGSSALSALGSRSAGASTDRNATAGSAPGAPAAPQRPDSTLPTRTPMAQTPPLPAHIPPPPDTDDSPAGPGRPGSDQGGAAAGAVSAKIQEADQSAGPGGLPRRAVTSPDERPPSMAAAAQALAGRGPATTQQPPGSEPTSAAQPGLAPPVIPGAGGAGRSAAGPAVPAPAARPTIPPATPAPVDRPQGASHPTAPPSRPEPAATGPGTDFDEDFVPANEVERNLYHAVDEGSTDSFLSTLLLATVLVPVADNSRPGSAPGESGFAFRTEEIDGDRFLVVFTSRDRLAEHFAEPTRTVGVRFVDLIRNWPDPAWSFAVNPTSPVGAKYPGPQVIALATWAVEAGLGGDPMDAPVAQPQRPAEPTAQLTIMQKAVPAEQIDYYLERGYDRVAGFVHRSGEVEHLKSPGDLFAALGLVYDGSPYQGDAKEAFVLRWPAHRPSLYRIPYGGQSEQALRAMDGWVIERPPFRGNGFAPGEGKDVIAEFKVDSVRLPHGAQLWRMDADGAEQMIAVFDCDAPVWRRVGEQ